MYELLIKGGEVLDPGQGLGGIQDIAISGGRIERIAPRIDPREARRVVDVRGRLVTPGLIDLHAHVYRGVATEGVNEINAPPDLVGVQSGVTTVVDAGSAGSHNFGGFLRYTVPASRTRLLAFLHICRTGLLVHPDAGDRQSIDLEATIKTIEAHKPLIRGVKLRMVSPGVDVLGLEMARLAIRAARETGTRFMVHIGDTTIPPSPNASAVTWQMLNLMALGDIITHIYTANPGGVLDKNGRVVRELVEARERGVVLDSSQGRRNFSFDAARRLLDQGVVADVISTDLVMGGRYEIVYCLTECMSKFLLLGFSLEDVIRMATANPARALGLSDSLGAIAVGRQADLSVLELVEGEWEFADAFGGKARGEKALVPVLTVRTGELIAPDWGPHPWGWLPATAATRR